MNCDEYKDLITISVFGELTHDELTGLHAHLRDCPICAAAYERSEGLSDLCDQEENIPIPDKEKSWSIISARALKKKRDWFKGIETPRPVFQYALVLLLLVVSFSAGYFFRSDKIKGSQLAQLQTEIGQIRELAAASFLRQESLNMRLSEIGLDTASATPYGMPLGYLFSPMFRSTEEEEALSRPEQKSPLVDLALSFVRQINKSETY
jgi:hypothetical protein